ncbi:hypothetical protein F1C76_13065 [Geodermatophilaceae bacterium NBWT11]|nr:hypothetical protein F1C76_13065 [Geodermatophilaceae bacterium NBWT11]
MTGFTGGVRGSGRVVTEQWRALLPTAHLLTGSDAEARDLLLRGLAAVRDGDDRDAALRGLVRAHLRRRLRGSGTLVGTPTPPFWVSPADAASAARLAAALDRLTPAQRAAVVLRFHEGVPDTTALVPDTDPVAAAALLADEVPDPADLPARLDGLAALSDAGTLTDETVALGVRGVTTDRRRRVALAVGAVAVLAVGAVLAPGLTTRDAPTAAAPSATPTASPTRGSLAADDGFLRDVRTALDPGWRSTGADGWTVEFAGDLSGVRAVLLSRGAPDTTELTWLTGPAGAPAGELDSVAWSPGQAPEAAAVVVGPDQGVADPTLLVVGRPGDELRVSPGLDVAADGSTSEVFADVPVSEDGVAAVAVRPDGDAVRYQVVRDDLLFDPAVPFDPDGPAVVADLGDGAEPPTPAGPPSRSGAATSSARALAVALSTIGDATGWAPEQLDVTVLGAGTFPLPGGTDADAVSVAAVLPDGGLVTTTAWASVGTQTTSWGSCGSTGHPAGTDPASLTVAARCGSYAGDGSTFGVTLLVAAPPGVPVVLGIAAGGTTVTPGLDRGWGFVVADADAFTEVSADGVPGTVTREGADLFSR